MNSPESDRCIATTMAGSRCRNQAQGGTAYCHVHMPASLLANESAGRLEPARREPDRKAAGQDGARGSNIPVEEDESAAFAGQGAEIPIEEEELSDRELRQRLVQEVDRLVKRLQRAYPDYQPPPFSGRRLFEFLDQQADQLPPGLRRSAWKRLRGVLNEDLLEAETWKGMWFMVNYTLEYQGDILKRRLKGDYETDEWGMDWEFIEVIRPFLDFLYKVYWRVETSGVDYIPDYDRALLVSNHSGQLPWDGAMIMTAVLNEHPAQRLVRNMYGDWFPSVPFLSGVLVKLGQVLASEENGVRLLENEELVGLFPEGYKGVGKVFGERYQLSGFGRGGFARTAIKTQTPIIPVSVVGAEETYISLHQSRTLARLTGAPYFPISLRFPWLGPAGLIPLPSKWYIDFGEPISTTEFGPDAADNLVLVSQLADQTQDVVQAMIDQRLEQRRSAYW